MPCTSALNGSQGECEVGLKRTMVDWYNFCREVCEVILVEESLLLGGLGRLLKWTNQSLAKESITEGGGLKVFGYWEG